MQETQVRSLGQEDPLEKEIATHSSVLAWEIPWIEEPGRLQSMGWQRIGQDWETKQQQIDRYVCMLSSYQRLLEMEFLHQCAQTLWKAPATGTQIACRLPAALHVCQWPLLPAALRALSVATATLASFDYHYCCYPVSNWEAKKMGSYYMHPVIFTSLSTKTFCSFVNLDLNSSFHGLPF